MPAIRNTNHTPRIHRHKRLRVLRPSTKIIRRVKATDPACSLLDFCSIIFDFAKNLAVTRKGVRDVTLAAKLANVNLENDPRMLALRKRETQQHLFVRMSIYAYNKRRKWIQRNRQIGKLNNGPALWMGQPV